MTQNKKRYMANIHNTGSLIEESKKVLQLFSQHKDEDKVREILLEENPLNRESEGTIQKIFFITRKRYLRKNPWPLIKVLESDVPKQTTDAIMFYYFAKTDNLVYDLTTELLFELYSQGNLAVSKKDVETFLDEKEEEHPEIAEWSITTRNKTIRHYLAAVKDFGLLKGSKQKEFANFHLPVDAFFYVFYYLHDTTEQDATEVLRHHDWRLYLLDDTQIKAAASEGSRRGHIDYDEAGDITAVHTNHDSLEDYVNEIT